MSAPSENYYDDAPAAPAAAASDKPEAKEGDEGSETFIVPKSAFGGRELKPGDKCDIEIKAVHENDVECSPCEGHEDKPEESAAPAGMPGEASETAGMME